MGTGPGGTGIRRCRGGSPHRSAVRQPKPWRVMSLRSRVNVSEGLT